MKRITVTIAVMAAVLLLAVGLTGCINVNLGGLGSIIGNGVMETREVTISSALTGVRNMGSFDVLMDPSLKGKAELSGEQNILDQIDARQDASGVFIISWKNGISISTSRGVQVRMPVISGGTVEMSGSGSIRLASGAVLESSRLDLRLNGSGDIELAVSASDITANINGSGDIRASGSTKGLKVSINGSGSFDGFDLASSTVEVSIFGSGDANVDVSQSLTGSVNGSGDVTYSGSPATVNVGGMGSGEVHKR